MIVVFFCPCLKIRVAGSTCDRLFNGNRSAKQAAGLASQDQRRILPWCRRSIPLTAEWCLLSVGSSGESRFERHTGLCDVCIRSHLRFAKLAHNNQGALDRERNWIMFSSHAPGTKDRKVNANLAEARCRLLILIAARRTIFPTIEK